jgi:hypothetical protein
LRTKNEWFNLSNLDANDTYIMGYYFSNLLKGNARNSNVQGAAHIDDLRYVEWVVIIRCLNSRFPNSDSSMYLLLEKKFVPIWEKSKVIR